MVDGKSRRYAMIPAFGMVILPQNPSTGDGQIPGCSCILSVDRLVFSGPRIEGSTISRHVSLISRIRLVCTGGLYVFYNSGIAADLFTERHSMSSAQMRIDCYLVTKLSRRNIPAYPSECRPAVSATLRISL